MKKQMMGMVLCGFILSCLLPGITPAKEYQKDDYKCIVGGFSKDPITSFPNQIAVDIKYKNYYLYTQQWLCFDKGDSLGANGVLIGRNYKCSLAFIETTEDGVQNVGQRLNISVGWGGTVEGLCPAFLKFYADHFNEYYGQ